MGFGEVRTGEGLHQRDVAGFEVVFEVGWEHAGLAGNEEQDDVGHFILSAGEFGYEYRYECVPGCVRDHQSSV